MNFSRILFEYPEGWTDVNTDPLALQHVVCMETIRAAANELGLEFSIRTSLRLADFSPRHPPLDTLMISVHTIGVANNVVRLKEAYLPGLYYFDRSGYSGWAELAYNVELQEKAVNYDTRNSIDFIKILRDEKIRLNTSKYPQPNETKETTLSQNCMPYVFMALQTSDDFVSSLATVNQLLLAEALAEKICELNMHLVIKRHPLCRDYNVENTIDRLSRKYESVTISGESVNRLIHGATAVVTVNSGVGFEALIMGVPVITAGRSDYSFITHKISHLDDLKTLSEMFLQVDPEKIASMVKFHVEQYCITCGDVQKAVDFIKRWRSDEYSNMHHLHGYEDCVMNHAQAYLASLEKMRRSMCVREKQCSLGERYSGLLGVFGDKIAAFRRRNGKSSSLPKFLR